MQNNSLKKAIKNALFGIWIVAKDQRNFRIQLTYTVVVIVLSILLNVTGLEWFMISLSIISVLVAEMVNTIAEYLCNLIEEKKRIEVKIIKDMAAGVVLIFSLWSVVVTGIVLIW